MVFAGAGALGAGCAATGACRYVAVFRPRLIAHCGQPSGAGVSRPPEDGRYASPGGAGRAAPSEAALGERMNANTVAVVSGTPGGTYFRMASDMAFVLDDGDDLRILPILGKGAGQNAYDIRFLKGVDLGFVRTDTLDQLREDKRLTNVDRHITYIARLFNDELHVIAPREITDIRQLAGKKVSFDVKGSGTDYTGRSMFKGLGLDDRGGEHRPGDGLRSPEARRARGGRLGRGKARRGRRRLRSRRALPRPAGALRRRACRQVLSGDADEQGLPEARPGGRDREHARGRDRARRL